MSQFSMFDSQEWSTIIVEVMRQAGLSSVTVDYEKVREAARQDPHALELLVYSDHIELHRITREEAAVLRANDPSIYLCDKDNQVAKGKVVPFTPKS